MQKFNEWLEQRDPDLYNEMGMLKKLTLRGLLIALQGAKAAAYGSRGVATALAGLIGVVGSLSYLAMLIDEGLLLPFTMFGIVDPGDILKMGPNAATGTWELTEPLTKWIEANIKHLQELIEENGPNTPVKLARA